MMSWPSALGTACISHGPFSSSLSWLLEALTWTGKEEGGGGERTTSPVALGTSWALRVKIRLKRFNQHWGRIRESTMPT